MLPIQNIFTGQNVGTVYPETPRTDRAIENFYRQQYEMNKMNLIDAQERQKQFLDYSSVAPIQAISKQHQVKQAEMIEGFQKTAKDIYNKRGGRLSTTDYLELQNLKNDLGSWQKNLQANQAMYMQDIALLNQPQNRYKFDLAKRQDAEKLFMDKGVWNRDLAFTPSVDNILEEYGDTIKNIKESSKFYPVVVPEAGSPIDANNRAIYYTKTLADPTNKQELTNRDARREFKAMTLDSQKKQTLAIADFDRLLENNADLANDYLNKAEFDKKKGTSPEEMNNAILNYAADRAGMIDNDDPYIIDQRSSVRSIRRSDGGGDKKDRTDEVKVIEAQTSKIQGGKVLKVLSFPYNVNKIPLSANTFPQLRSEGYPLDQDVDVEFRRIYGDEFEADISYQDKVPSWKSISGNKVYPNDMVRQTMEGYGEVIENGKKITVKAAPSLNKKITVAGKISEAILDALESSGFKDIRSKYAEYLKQNSSTTKTGVLD